MELIYVVIGRDTKEMRGGTSFEWNKSIATFDGCNDDDRSLHSNGQHKYGGAKI